MREVRLQKSSDLYYGTEGVFFLFLINGKEIWLAAALGLVVLAFFQLTAGPFTRLLAGGAGPVAEAGEQWLRVASIGLPLLLVLCTRGLVGVAAERFPPLVRAPSWLFVFASLLTQPSIRSSIEASSITAIIHRSLAQFIY